MNMTVAVAIAVVAVVVLAFRRAFEVIREAQRMVERDEDDLDPPA